MIATALTAVRKDQGHTITSSADVAARAGVSRSTVSQILNGHGHRFRPDMVLRVQTVARELGYRPSLAGRALARGTSDVVITLLPDISFGPRLRELVDRVTDELSAAGKTNLIRLSAGDSRLDDAVLALRPAGLWSVTPLTDGQLAQLERLGVTTLAQPRDLQHAIDHEIGARQARHLIEQGYPSVTVALPQDRRELPFASAREQGALEACAEAGVRTHDTLHLSMQRGSAAEIIRCLPAEPTGIAAYNDDIALAVMAAAHRANRRMPDDIGLVGVDNTLAAGTSSPTLTTIDIDVRSSAHEIVQALLHGPGSVDADALARARDIGSLVVGESSRRRG